MDQFVDNLKEEAPKPSHENSKRFRVFDKKDDGRMQAYGWSLSSKKACSKDSTSLKGQKIGNKGPMSVPYPIHYGCLTEDSVSSKISCSASVKLGGGDRDRCEVKEEVDSMLRIKGDESKEDLINKDKAIKSYSEYHEKLQQLSSLVWIITHDEKGSFVRIIDANKPSEVIKIFQTNTNSHAISITSVPGKQFNFSLPLLIKPIL